MFKFVTCCHLWRFIVLIVGFISVTEEQENFDGCIETNNFLSSCWTRRDDMALCMNDAVKLMNLRCSNDATLKYMRRQIQVMNLTGGILDSVIREFPYKACFARLHAVTVTQGQFIMDGYSAPDGCSYLALLSSLAAVVENEASECAALTHILENNLLHASGCDNNYNSISNELVDDNLQLKMITCLEINAKIRQCVELHSQCSDTFSKMVKCFKDATKNIADCELELIQRTVKEAAKTSIDSLKYFCSDNFTPFTRITCTSPFWKITSAASKIIPNFHTPQNCRDKNLYFDHVVSTTSEICRDVLKQFSQHILHKSACSAMLSKANNLIFGSTTKFILLLLLFYTAVLF